MTARICQIRETSVAAGVIDEPCQELATIRCEATGHDLCRKHTRVHNAKLHCEAGAHHPIRKI